MSDKRTLKEIVAELRGNGMGCNCDLDNWQPNTDSGHSWVCRLDEEARRIHKQENKE